MHVFQGFELKILYPISYKVNLYAILNCTTICSERLKPPDEQKLGESFYGFNSIYRIVSH